MIMVFHLLYKIILIIIKKELFRNTNHQDAQEMLNYTLNALFDILKEQKIDVLKHFNSDYDPKKEIKTWLDSLFDGQLTNETKCLTCERITSRLESFLDLSLDVDSNVSLTGCLNHFSSSELLCHRNKFYCDSCFGLEEAEKR